MPASSMSIIASTARLSGANVFAGAIMSRPTGVRAGQVLGDELPAQVGVGHDPEPLIELDEDARDVGGGHQPRRLRGARVGRADHDRPVNERAQMGGALLGLGMGDVAGADEPLPKRGGDELHASRARQHDPGGVGRDEEAHRGVAGVDVEGGRHPGEERRMPERLAGLEDVDRLLLVPQLDRPGADDVEPLRGGAVLGEDRRAGGVRPFLRRCGDPLELRLGEAVERRKPAEELCGRAIGLIGLDHRARIVLRATTGSDPNVAFRIVYLCRPDAPAAPASRAAGRCWLTAARSIRRKRRNADRGVVDGLLARRSEQKAEEAGGDRKRDREPERERERVVGMPGEPVGAEGPLDQESDDEPGRRARREAR